ncbi:MAG TPA: efflux RND transporter permease subunit, partial [Afifellaceae bacterium]|nr:efflux RND transporter permease subunit [Afifellaceae bacterium]
DANILEIVEPAVQFVDGVKEMNSYAREGSATIRLEFERNADMQKALSDIEAAVTGVTNLPQDADTPDVSFSQWYDGVARLAIVGPFSEAALRYYAKKFRDDLVTRGIDKVTFTGLRDDEIIVTVPERDLRRLDLTVRDVSTAIAGNSRDLPSGTLEGTVSKQIRALSDAEDGNGLRDVEIRSFSSGEKVLLGDIASIARRFDPDDQQGLSAGRRAIELYVQRSATADTLKTAKILEDYLVEIRPTLPPGLEVLKYSVRAERVSERIGLLLRNGLQGLVLVVITLFIFLNGRVAFWVAAGIPVAMMATLGVMYVSGQSINMISLFALIMMLGVIVDDAIVVGEHTATRSQMGDPAAVAARRGAGNMLSPVMAASITTIAAFAPLFLVRDTMGQIMVALPLVVIAVVIASVVECFLVLPGHLAHSMKTNRHEGWSFWRWVSVSIFYTFIFVLLLRDWSVESPLPDALLRLRDAAGTLPAPALSALVIAFALLLGSLTEGFILWLAKRRRNSGHERGAFRRALDGGYEWFRDRPFHALVSLSFNYRYVTVAVCLASLILSVGMLRGGRVDFIFFPAPEAENINARLVFNAGTPRDTVVAAVGRIEQSLYDAAKKLAPGEPLVLASFVTIGSAGRSTGDNLASFRVQLASSEDRSIRTPEIVRAWREAAPKIAGVKRLSIYEQRSGPPGRDVDIRFRGADTATLKQAAEEASLVLLDIPGVSGVADDLPYGKPELIIRMTPRGAALGFTTDEIGTQVRNALEGTIPRRFAEGDDEITIRVIGKMREQGTAALQNLQLRTADGAFVPLTEVASLTERQGFAAIQRTNGNSKIAVTADVDTAVTTPGAITGQLRRDGITAAIASRHGVETGFSGRARERERAFVDLRIGSMIALAVIYIVLAWTFGSYLRPLAVMLIIPFGFVGAVFGHWLMGFDLTILSLFGLLGLSGILVNDSIILVARLNERLAQGDAIDTAAIGASRDRLRAVLLTSLTTIGGLTPMLFETSQQAQFLMPMAITMVFGLAVATLLVLFLVPSLIGIGNDIAGFFRFATARRLRTPRPV